MNWAAEAAEQRQRRADPRLEEEYQQRRQDLRVRQEKIRVIAQRKSLADAKLEKEKKPPPPPKLQRPLEPKRLRSSGPV
ncbi:hypothetical protein TYRP_009478 [Tyrophagus putrescentiae]|nr:hypothetical protein TYRP_009478 [Tyrophagus putrescentiae]